MPLPHSSPLDPADLIERLTGQRSLPAGFQRVSVPAGAELMRAGERADCLVLVLSGRCRVELPIGDEGAARECAAGALLGDVSFLDGGLASATVTAIDTLDAVQLTRSQFEGMRLASPGTAAAVMRGITRSLAARLRQATDEVEAATTGSIAQGAARRSLVDAFLQLFQGGA